MTTLHSYDLNGKKLSFADTIEMISPEDTPFLSMLKKEQIYDTVYNWQVDYLSAVDKDNAFSEGMPADPGVINSTERAQSHTQIFRKVVKVSDTLNVLDLYGKPSEMEFQIGQAVKEFKRNIEWAFLNQFDGRPEEGSVPRQTSGFSAQVSAFGTKAPVTGAVVYRESSKSNTIGADDLRQMTYNLYLANSKANIVMTHPRWMAQLWAISRFSKSGTKEEIYQNSTMVSGTVKEIVDPLGQKYTIIPNRWMPTDKIYFFNKDEVTKMVLREPTMTHLAKDGSYEKWMMEGEFGLRVENPFTVGVLQINRDSFPTIGMYAWKKMELHYTNDIGNPASVDLKVSPNMVKPKEGTRIFFKVVPKDNIPKPKYLGSGNHVFTPGDFLQMTYRGNLLPHQLPIEKNGDGTFKELEFQMTTSFDHTKHEGVISLNYYTAADPANPLACSRYCVLTSTNDRVVLDAFKEACDDNPTLL